MSQEARNQQQHGRQHTTVSDSNDVVTVIHCWSAPRSRSTALMYSFNARHDCISIDEPLYRRWLAEQGPCTTRPYKKFLLGGSSSGDTECDPDGGDWSKEQSCLQERIDGAVSSPGTTGTRGRVVFLKHMAKHSNLYDFQLEQEARNCTTSLPKHETQGVDNSNDSARDICKQTKYRHAHILLIRDPVAVLSSWKEASSNHGNQITSDELGIVTLLTICSSLQSRKKVLHQEEGDAKKRGALVVLDSDQLVNKTKFTLISLCDDVGIPYLDEMLHWKSGPKDCDGAWAKYWYKNVHETSGWSTRPTTQDETTSRKQGSTSYKPFDPNHMSIIRISMPAYQYLKGMECTSLHRGPGATMKLYEDSRNENILIWVGGENDGQLVPRDMAGVSPFDSAVQGGDAVWEGLRVYNGKILSFERHLKRLFNSAKAMAFNNVHTMHDVKDAVFQTLAVNGMQSEAHVRLTLTRGKKTTSSMNPKFNVYGTTLIVLAEWKATQGATTYDNTNGISLITAANRRNPPSTIDSKIHHNNLINNILPKIQANLANAADAIMLDLDGFVCETNATNIFMVDDKDVLLTPHADHCLPGITRETVLLLAKELEVATEVKRISLAEFHAADEVFTTGTMGGLTPVTMIDGRTIGTGKVGKITKLLQASYATLSDRPGWATKIPQFS